MIQKLPNYDEKLEAVISKAMPLLQDIIHKLGLQMETVNTGQVLQLTTISADAVSSALQSFMDFLGRAATVLLFMLFMLAGSGSLSDKIQHAYSPGDAYRILAGLQNISMQVRQYLVTKVFISLLTGVLTSLVLWLLGIEFPIFWGFLACLLNFIPYAVPLLALACPLVLALLQFDTLTRPLLALVIQGAMYAIIGNVVEPKLMASRLNVSVLLVLVSLIFWGWLWGLWGMILAVPLTITVKIVFENIGPLYPLSVLMSERVNPSSTGFTAPHTESKEQTYDRI